MNSEFLKLGWKDIGKGFLVAVLTVIVAGVSTSLNAGQFPDVETLKGLGLTGLAAGFAYLVKNFFTNSDGKVITPEPK